MDPFGGTSKISFIKDSDLPFRGTTKHTVIKCYFKVELWREINHMKQCMDTSSFLPIPLQFDMFNDEDPWIRTTYFVPSKVIDRCNSYRISISTHFGLKQKNPFDYLKEQRILYDSLGQNLQLQEEPGCGVTMSCSFFCIDYKEGLNFMVSMFLVNAIMGNAFIDVHQLNKFFDILIMKTREVNVTAVKHFYSYKHLVFAVYKSLQIVQLWLLKNPGPEDGAGVRRLVITSTKAYCLFLEDMIDLYMGNMVNENLGVNCNAHVVYADQSDYGVLEENYLEFVELAAAPVDFPKRGKLVPLFQVLKTKTYPDFMAKGESQLYNSDNILRELYRKTKDGSEVVTESLELICATEDVPNVLISRYQGQILKMLGIISSDMMTDSMLFRGSTN